MSYPLLAAAILSFAWCLIHVFIGGRDVAKPLREGQELTPMARDTLWFCWHIVTLVLLLMAGFFGAGALGYAPGLALAATLISCAIMILGVGAVPMIGQSYRVVPQGWLFLPTTLLGAWGVLV